MNVIDGSGYGIYLDSCQGSVTTNMVNRFAYTGLYLDDCYDMEIAENSVMFQGDWGIYLYEGENLTVRMNSFTANYHGMYAYYVDSSSISDNAMRASTYEGVVLYGLSSCTFENNDVSDNGAYGVNIYGGYGVVFGNNTVSNNEGIGVDIDAGTEDQIWIFNGWYEYNDGYGIYVEAEPYAPSSDWAGVQSVIDSECRLTFNEVYYDGEITVKSGGALYLDSLDCFQLRGSSVDGTATPPRGGGRPVVDAQHQRRFRFG